MIRLSHKIKKMKIVYIVLFLSIWSCNQSNSMVKNEPVNQEMEQMKNNNNLPQTEEAWKEVLSPEEYRILREAGTEAPYSGEYNMHFEKGVYVCGGCGAQLFDSTSKFQTDCGWPGFDQEIAEGKILERVDTSHGMTRTEILCAQCGGHLGHVFDDGPTETGLRYCVNSLSLDFEEETDSVR